MISDLLKLDEGDNLDINETCEILLLKEFKEIWTLNYNKGPKDHDGRKRLKARRILKYIYLMYHYKSPLADDNITERKKQALIDAKVTEEEASDKLVLDCIDRFNTILKSYKQIQLLEANKSMIDNAVVHIDTVDFNAVDEKGKIIYDITKYMKLPGEVKNMLDEFKKLEADVKASLKTDMSIRGNKEKGQFED